MGISNVVIWCLVVLTLEHSVAYEVGGIISGNRGGSVPLGVSLGDGDLDVEGICQRSGPTCLNCTYAVTCVALPHGWLRVPLQDCATERFTCNARLGGCTSVSVPECDEPGQLFEHICEQVGMFPDATDCRKFHMCTPPADYPHGRPADHRVVYCPRNYGYDPLTTQCRINLRHGQCEDRPVPACTKIGQTGALPNSPHHYFVCLSKFQILHPQIFVCPYGYYFYDNFCHSEPNPSSLNKTLCTLNNENVNTEITATLGPETTTETISSTTKAVKATEYPPDNFLGDKFNLKNYEALGESNPFHNENSWEYGHLSSEAFEY